MSLQSWLQYSPAASDRMHSECSRLRERSLGWARSHSLSFRLPKVVHEVCNMATRWLRRFLSYIAQPKADQLHACPASDCLLIVSLQCCSGHLLLHSIDAFSDVLVFQVSPKPIRFSPVAPRLLLEDPPAFRDGQPRSRHEHGHPRHGCPCPRHGGLRHGRPRRSMDFGHLHCRQG